MGESPPVLSSLRVIFLSNTPPILPIYRSFSPPWWDYAGPVRKSSGRPLRGVLSARKTELDFPLRLLLDYPVVGVGQPCRYIGGVGRKEGVSMRQNETEKRQFLLLFLFPLLADGFFASVRTNFIFMIADPVLSLPAPPQKKTESFQMYPICFGLLNISTCSLK